jgi:RNA polymerase sigma-70 factor (sigma-E family)
MATERDTTSFVEFAEARSAAMFRTAFLMLGDHGMAEDLLQEALTKTYVAWPRLRDVNAAESYTRKAITTTAISWWRRKSWRNELPHAEISAETAAPAGALEERDWMWRELQRLPPRQRATLVLRYYEDLTEAQTAEAMRCSVGTVKSQASDALKRLRLTVDPSDANPSTEETVNS